MYNMGIYHSGHVLLCFHPNSSKTLCIGIDDNLVQYSYDQEYIFGKFLYPKWINCYVTPNILYILAKCCISMTLSNLLKKSIFFPQWNIVIAHDSSSNSEVQTTIWNLKSIDDFLCLCDKMANFQVKILNLSNSRWN